MYTAVKKFLALHHHLSLPGIGSFTVETIPAQINIANRSILPSNEKINFSNEILPSEKKFYSFLSEELSVDETQAQRSFIHFVDDLKSDLLDKKEILFKGIGKLIQPADEIIFKADELPVYYPELTAERIIRKNTTHTVRVGEDERSSTEMHTHHLQTKEKIINGEKWWIPALILAIIGIAAIVGYYMVLHPSN